jgi:hypothetical protein
VQNSINLPHHLCPVVLAHVKTTQRLNSFL